MVANGEVNEKDYMDKLSKYVTDYTNDVKNKDFNDKLRNRYGILKKYYK